MKISTILDHIDNGHMASRDFRRCVQKEIPWEDIA